MSEFNLGHHFVNFNLDRCYASVVLAFVRENELVNTSGRLLSLNDACHSMVVSWVLENGKK